MINCILFDLILIYHALKDFYYQFVLFKGVFLECSHGPAFSSLSYILLCTPQSQFLCLSVHLHVQVASAKHLFTGGI